MRALPATDAARHQRILEPAHRDQRTGLVHPHVVIGDGLAGGLRGGQLGAHQQADRHQVLLAGGLRGHRPAVVVVAAHALEGDAGLQIELGAGDDLGGHRGGLEVGPAVQHGLADRQRRLDGGDVPRPQQHVVRPGAELEVVQLVGHDVAGRLHHDEDARGHVAGDVLDDRPLVAVQDAAVGPGDQHLGELVAVALHSVHALDLDREPGGVGERRHLELGLGAVGELGEHARVHLLAGGLGLVVGGDRGGDVGVVLALADGDHLEPEVLGVLDELEALDRLVAAADGVDGVPGVGHAAEQHAHGDVRLDGHQGDVGAVGDAGVGDLRGDLRDPGDLQHDVDRQPRHVQPVADRDGAALADGRGGGVEVVSGAEHVGDAGVAQGGFGLLDDDVRDGRDRHAGRPRDLGDQAGAHLTGADDADADGVAGLGLTLQEALGVTHDVVPSATGVGGDCMPRRAG